MEAFTYKGISDGKYVQGDIEAINLDEASHLLKEQKIIITNIVKSKKKKSSDKKKSGGFSLFGGKKKVKVEDVLIFYIYPYYILTNNDCYKNLSFRDQFQLL